MKRYLFFCMMVTFLCATSVVNAQPMGITYQAIARDSAGNLLANQNVSIRFSIHDSIPGGTIIYSETHGAVTNSLGLFTSVIGHGSVVTGSFTSISWGSNAKFLQVEMDAAGGVNYADMGTQQLMSVPYALHAGNLPQGTAPGNTLYWNGTSWIAGGSLVNNGSSVGIGAAPDSSAALEVSSSNKGLLLPRLTTLQREAIVNPATGLIIYNTDSNCLEMRTPTSWLSFCDGICTPLPTTANAGPDQNNAENPVLLNANTPVFGNGYWSLVSGSGGMFSDTTNPSSEFTGDPGLYILRWNIFNSCGTSSDDVYILFQCENNTADCNGLVEDGCETDLLTDLNACGNCSTSCSTAFPNAIATCDNGECMFGSCLPGYYDLDGDVNNGCEYACTFTSSTDNPDMAFVDANCDGIDGMVASAIFVATSGSDLNPGTKASPKATIAAAISAAGSTAKPHVYISAGNYPGTVTLVNGISLYGGYSALAGWSRSNSNISTITANAVISGRVTGIQGTAVTATTTIDLLTVTTGNNSSAGGSNYGIYCNGCTALRITNNSITAGSGANGQAGSAVGNGANGNAGSNGNPGDCDINGPGGAGGAGGTSACGRQGGNGGAGGSTPSGSGQTGLSGAGGTTGGTGGSTGDPGSDGQNGNIGSNGGAGTNGNAGTGGAVLGGFWTGGAGGTGTAGGHGNGGGGGGGGGSQSGTFANDGPGNGGGGGGAGGCQGPGGNGGTAGGGSFGVFMHNSTGALLSGNTITSGNGGNGGPGGNGGTGGTGGNGGFGATTCTSEIGEGGDGGKGGNGGNGGHGGGGAGGASYSVYRSSTTLSTTGNTLIFGSGGAGGPSAGNAGITGASGTAF